MSPVHRAPNAVIKAQDSFVIMFICTCSFIRTCTCTCSFICTCTCTCSFICTCLYVHVPLYVHVHVLVPLYVHVHVHVPLYVHVHVQAPLYVHVHVLVPLYVHVHVLVPLYVHVHVQVPLYVHVYLFTRICILHTHYLAETIPVRLVNGKRASEGRIELLHNGEWGTICNYYTDINVGHVVCRELGYPGADKITTYAAFGEGKGHVLLAPKCIGNETTLLHCEHTGWGRYEKHCDHSHDSGVICIDGKYYQQLKK